jgi:HD superfamily phosphodiesterase
MSQESILQELSARAKRFYKQFDFAHDEKHVERVVAFAKILQGHEDGNAFLIEAGAWLHQFHDHVSELKELLSDVLRQKTMMSRLVQIVTECRPDKITETSSLEAKIVFDADALELMGPYGIIREVLCNAVARGKPWEESVRDARETQRLFEDRLMTDAAKKLAKEAIKVSHRFWRVYEQWHDLRPG